MFRGGIHTHNKLELESIVRIVNTISMDQYSLYRPRYCEFILGRSGFGGECGGLYTTQAPGDPGDGGGGGG